MDEEGEPAALEAEQVQIAQSGSEPSQQEVVAQKWDAIMTEIEGAKRYASVDPAASPVQDEQEPSQPADGAGPEQSGHAVAGGQDEDEEINSYCEPSYDDHDQSDSYEPTYYKKSEPINKLIDDQTPEQHHDVDPVHESASSSSSDDSEEAAEEYECTHD